MIVERRSYQVDSGQEQEFWAVQRDWYWPPEIGDFYHHLVGYFETIGPGPKEIVHLYRFDSLAQWEATYRALYQRFPPDYFTVVRKLLSAQQNMFMAPAPVDLPTIAPLGEAVGPPAGFGSYGKALPSDLIVQEVVTEFLPGGLFTHWDAIRTLQKPSAALRHNLIGVFSSMTGRFHRMIEYRWFLDHGDAVQHQLALEREEEASSVMMKSAAVRIGSEITYLKPAPFGWLRPLFEPMDWPAFEARDLSQKRIAPWPPAKRRRKNDELGWQDPVRDGREPRDRPGDSRARGT